MNGKDKYKVLLKLHRQFAHPSLKKLSALLQYAGNSRRISLICFEQMGENCDLCQRYAKTPPLPVVSLSMASHFNEKVAMD